MVSVCGGKNFYILNGRLHSEFSVLGTKEHTITYITDRGRTHDHKAFAIELYLICDVRNVKH